VPSALNASPSPASAATQTFDFGAAADSQAKVTKKPRKLKKLSSRPSALV
jgi:hypothetical protein